MREGAFTIALTRIGRFLNKVGRFLNKVGKGGFSFPAMICNPAKERWSRLFEQIFRLDWWSVCQG
jgi:hypothetical protein